MSRMSWSQVRSAFLVLSRCSPLSWQLAFSSWRLKTNRHVLQVARKMSGHQKTAGRREWWFFQNSGAGFKRSISFWAPMSGGNRQPLSGSQRAVTGISSGLMAGMYEGVNSLSAAFASLLMHGKSYGTVWEQSLQLYLCMDEHVRELRNILTSA